MKMKILFILIDSMLATSVTLPAEMIVSAGQHAKANKLAHISSEKIELIYASEVAGVVTCHTGIELNANKTIDQIDEADIVFIPALWRNPQKAIDTHPKIIHQINMLYTKGSVICGVGTGCCFMAETGILDNKAATTHWHYFDTFTRKYPSVKLQKHYFITQADRCYCAASLNSLADLTIHLIKQQFSSTISKKVEQHFSHEIRRDYETQRFLESESDYHPDEAILHAEMQLQSYFNRPLSMKTLAKDCGMSLRNFSRRFKLATGTTPTAYLQKIRVQHAKELIGSSNLSIVDIAYKTGFTNASYFNSVFKKHYFSTPSQYRLSLRSKLFSR